METWEYAELVLMAPSMEATTMTFGLVKGVLQFAIFGDKAGPKKYEPKQFGDVVVWLGKNGWELVSATESLQPNNWLRTRWIFKRSQPATTA